MQIPVRQPDWPDSWLMSHRFDSVELDSSSRDPYAVFYRQRLDTTLRLLASIARPPARVLDLAAAQGNFTLALAERGFQVTWNDLRAELADYVRLKASASSLQRVTFAPGNAFELNLQPFDVVLAGEVVEHVAHPDRFIAQIASLAQPGGFVVLTTPNGAYFRNTLPKFSDCPDPSAFEKDQFQPDGDGHIFLLHPEELLSLASDAGLRLVQFELFGNPLTCGHVKLRHVLPLLPQRAVEKLELWSQHSPRPLRRKVHTGMAATFERTK